MTDREFGAAVRRLRESADPTTAGVPLGLGTRRVRGLRREELGELAGMSADYVRRLEQGRSHPSAAVVDALARALGASRADYERLCVLAGYAAADGRVPTELGPGATRLLERFSDTPMFVADAAMNLLAVTSPFLALEHWQPTGERWEWNIAWRQFCSPFATFQQSTADATDHEAILAATLKAATLRYPTDAGLAALVDDIRSRSAMFDGLWRDPRPVTAYESSATFLRSDGEPVTLLGNLLAIPGDDLSALMLTAARGSADEARLAEVVAAASGQSVLQLDRPAAG